MIKTYEHRLKGMTYILGSNCSDGVVLVGDRKVTLERGATYEYEDKLFLDVPWTVVGSSGVSGLFEKFRENLMAYLASPERENTVSALTTQIEVLTRELNEKYKGILHGQDFDVLLGIKTTVGAALKYVYPFGFAEGVRNYKVIGHGEPYGSFFMKRWWRKDMKMLEVAELGFFIIKYIQEFPTSLVNPTQASSA
jgi:20S proteasome alpha/beta subunit